jgi:hypothetical protein
MAPMMPLVLATLSTLALGEGGPCQSGWGAADSAGRTVEEGQIDPATGTVTVRNGTGQVIGWGWVLPDGTAARLLHPDGRLWKQVPRTPRGCVFPPRRAPERPEWPVPRSDERRAETI